MLLGKKILLYAWMTETTTKIFDGNLAVALDRQVKDTYSTVPLSQPPHQVSGAPEHHL